MGVGTIEPTGINPPEVNRTWQWQKLEDAKGKLEELYEATIDPPKGTDPFDHRAHMTELAMVAIAHLDHAIGVEGPEDALLAAREVLGLTHQGIAALKAAPIGAPPTGMPDLVVLLERAMDRVRDAQAAIENTDIGFG